MARDKDSDNERWAVENTNLDTGVTVRYMETPQRFVADTFVDRANAAFEKNNVNCLSEAIKI